MNGFGKIPLGTAILALLSATVLFGATLTEAVRVGEYEPLSEAPAASGMEEEGDVSGPSRPYPRTTEAELLEAVNQDLFQPDRTPPLERYRFPSDGVVTPADPQQTRGRRGRELRVVGSATMGEKAVALVQVDDSVPLVLFLGESVEGYTLASVAPESATLVSPDETLILPVVEPVLGRQAGQGQVQAQINPTDLEQFRARMQEVLRAQRMNERGGRGRGGGTP